MLQDYQKRNYFFNKFLIGLFELISSLNYTTDLATKINEKKEHFTKNHFKNLVKYEKKKNK